MRDYFKEIFKEFFTSVINEEGKIADYEGYIFFIVAEAIMCISGWGLAVVNNSFGKSLLMLLFFISIMLQLSALDYGEKENAKWQKSEEEKKKRNEQYTSQRYYPSRINRY